MSESSAYQDLNSRQDTAEPPMGAISFGPFRLIASQRLLLKEDKPVQLGGRALDILIALTAKAGQPVTKDELITIVWGGGVVEDSNLKVNISTLRKALGDGEDGNRYVTNIPRRGYCFVAPVALAKRFDNPAPSRKQDRTNNLPQLLTKVIGRDDTISLLASQLEEHRFVTIVGAGGIGKTAVALSVAKKLLGSYKDGARFVDLAPVRDPSLVASALAAVLHTEVRTENALPDLLASLRECHVLLLFDSCEHVIEAVAKLTVSILKAYPYVHTLATSREPLRVEGESVHRLPPLGLPPESIDLTAAEALTYPAIQLFCERATASFNEFRFGDEEAPIIARICRRLDGLALAIELAAARIDSFGLEGLADQIEHRFQLLTRGWRTSLPRQQTIQAALDWTYEWLTEPERLVLRRLAIFSGSFTVQAATRVAASTDLGEADLINKLSDLVTKSLIMADIEHSNAHYRLIQITRAHALEKLIEAGEFEAVSRRHAEYYRDYFESLESQLSRRHGDQVLAEYRQQIDDIRAATDWAFTTNGTEAIGVALTAATAPIWIQLSLIAECRTRVERALGILGPKFSGGPRSEMQLCAALGMSLVQIEGPSSGTHRAWVNALEIAERLNDQDYQLRALSGLWVYHMLRGDCRMAESFAKRFCDLTLSHGDAADILACDRMMGILFHHLGDQSSARRHIEQVLRYFNTPAIPAHAIGFVANERVVGQSALARILWLQGYPEQAIDAAARGTEIARSIHHEVSLCYSLAAALCPVALWVGNLSQAERAIAMLVGISSRRSLRAWNAWGRYLKGALLIEDSKVIEGLQFLGPAIKELRDTGDELQYTSFLGEFAKGLGRAGKISEGLDAINEALDLSEKNEERWYSAELLGIKGDLLLLQSKDGARAQAEDQYESALKLARSQGALSFELRSAMRLFCLKRDTAGGASASARLKLVYDRFSEGFGTADLKEAKALLDKREAIAPFKNANS